MSPNNVYASKFIDISLTLSPDIPIWPGSVGFRLTPTKRLEAGDTENVSRLDCDVHIGTHVDAPRHFLTNGATVEQLPLDVLIGQAFVGCVPEDDLVTRGKLAGLDIPNNANRLLLRTRNSHFWERGVSRFRKDYVALTAEAAHWVVERGIRLIGVDYLSVQCWQDPPRTHEVLLEAGVVILEGLNLAGVEEGTYDLICLPLKIAGAEGSPARAVLRRLTPLASREVGGT
ncbi:MAG: cyclase family protein [Deltaproteobacteria bacterium]|nr:MAG: cyclase family protein [Deltaproteobacteria bacterium]